MQDGEGRGMEETRNRLRVIDGEGRHRPRLAALVARVDAGEEGAMEALERRIRGDHEDLVRCGRTRMADEAWAWAIERVAEVERAEERAERAEGEGEMLRPEAPGRWRGLRVRASYAGGGGTQRPSELVGRLAEVSERGVLISVDDLLEDRSEDAPASAGTISRRVRSERLICWTALLGLMPLPVRGAGEEV